MRTAGSGCSSRAAAATMRSLHATAGRGTAALIGTRSSSWRSCGACLGLQCEIVATAEEGARVSLARTPLDRDPPPAAWPAVRLDAALGQESRPHRSALPRGLARPATRLACSWPLSAPAPGEEGRHTVLRPTRLASRSPRPAPASSSPPRLRRGYRASILHRMAAGKSLRSNPRPRVCSLEPTSTLPIRARRSIREILELVHRNSKRRSIRGKQ